MTLDDANIIEIISIDELHTSIRYRKLGIDLRSRFTDLCEVLTEMEEGHY